MQRADRSIVLALGRRRQSARSRLVERGEKRESVMREFVLIGGIFVGAVGLNLAFPSSTGAAREDSTPNAETPVIVVVSEQPDFDDFLYAMRMVESNDNPAAVGDGGKAIGAYQIWESYWKDAMEFDPSIGGTYQDCYNTEYAEKIVRAYMNRYATPERIGRVATFEDMARIHNGGCNVFRKKGTKAWNNTTVYWNKIEKILNQ